jgi:hypothetical protein
VTSVEAGAKFQQTLWARMADVDVLVFLDTKEALTSQWVRQELARAHDLGLGVLQLIWPGQTRTAGTEFSDFIALDQHHFVNGKATRDDRLEEAALKEIGLRAEQARVRSLRARRLRVVSDLVDQAKRLDISAVVHPVEPVALFRAQQKLADVIPFVGVPDAYSIQQREGKSSRESLEKSLLLYNGLGVDPDWMDHLNWLNKHHDLKTRQVDKIKEWLQSL